MFMRLKSKLAYRPAHKLTAALAACALVLLSSAPLLAAAAAEAEHAPPAELMSENVKTFLWALVVFLIVLGVLWKYAWGPLIKALDERELKIRASLEAAERAIAESQERERRFEEMMAKARREAAAMVEEGKRDAVTLRERIVQDAKKESEALLKRANADIARAKENAVQELQQLAVGLSIAIAERVIEKSLNPADHQRLIQETIQRYGKLGA